MRQSVPVFDFGKAVCEGHSVAAPELCITTELTARTPGSSMVCLSARHRVAAHMSVLLFA
eukprot:894272-Rhodomonas_salina.6